MSNKTKSKSRLSVQEFQTWLQGIMEFQSSDWSPNAEQWVAIYDKIMNLKNEDTVSTSNISAASLRKIEDAVEEIVEGKLRNFNQAPRAAAPEYQEPRPPVNRPPAPGLFDEPEDANPAPHDPNMIQPGQELISAEEFQQLSQEEIDAKIRAATQGKTPSVVGNAQSKHKTPNVDSTHGYNSSFT